MGGKSSKQQNLTRNNSARGSQRKIFQKIQKKFALLRKNVNSFTGEDQSPAHLKTKSSIMTVRFELEELKNNLKDKHKQTHDNWLQKIDDLLEELDKKARDHDSVEDVEETVECEKKKDHAGKENGTKTVELTLVQLATEKRNSQYSLKQSNSVETLSNGVPNIEKLRQDVLKMRKRILAFKGENFDDEYIEIKDHLINIFIDVDNIDICAYPQLRRERNLGLDDVQNCFKLLEEVVVEQNNQENELEDHEVVDKNQETEPKHGKIKNTGGHVRFASQDGGETSEEEDVRTFSEIIKERSSLIVESSDDEGEFFVKNNENNNQNDSKNSNAYKKPTIVTSF